MAVGGLPSNLPSLKKISVWNFSDPKADQCQENVLPQVLFLVQMPPFEDTYTCFLEPRALAVHWFFFPFLPSKTLHLLSSSTSSCLFRFGLKLVKEEEGEKKNPLWRIMLTVSETTLCSKNKSIFLLWLFLCVCLCVCVFWLVSLQVVGLDPDQTTLSRGGATSQGQGCSSGSPEGPPGRHGTAKSLGRKLPGECVGLAFFHSWN